MRQKLDYNTQNTRIQVLPLPPTNTKPSWSTAMPRGLGSSESQFQNPLLAVGLGDCLLVSLGTKLLPEQRARLL